MFIQLHYKTMILYKFVESILYSVESILYSCLTIIVTQKIRKNWISWKKLSGLNQCQEFLRTSIWQLRAKIVKIHFTYTHSFINVKTSYPLRVANSEAVVRRCNVKNVFLEILQNSQENTCARASFLIKLQPWVLQLYWKRYSGTGVFLWILWNF